MNVYVRELSRGLGRIGVRRTCSPAARTRHPGGRPARHRRSRHPRGGGAGPTDPAVLARRAPRRVRRGVERFRSHDGASTTCSTATTGSRASRPSSWRALAAAGLRCSTPSARSRTGARSEAEREPEIRVDVEGRTWRRRIASWPPPRWSARTWPGTTAPTPSACASSRAGWTSSSSSPETVGPRGPGSASRPARPALRGPPRADQGPRDAPPRAGAARADGLRGPTSGWSWSAAQGRPLGR